MHRDALICRQGKAGGWAVSVIPVGLIPSFVAAGWIVVLSSDEMRDLWTAEIEAVRQSDERTWTPIRWKADIEGC